MKPVAVLGSGPAGMCAAWALNICGIPTVVISSGGKSRLGPAQFFHGPIPELNDPQSPDAIIKFIRRGDPDIYKLKAFGNLKVPWEPWTDAAPVERAAWSLQETYDTLWRAFGDYVTKEEIKPESIDKYLDMFDGIISTVPMRALCTDPTHLFVTQDIKIHTECFEPNLDDNTVVLDGTGEKSWYRTSRIFGVGGTEWGPRSEPVRGLDPVYKDFKPISTTCTCLKGRGILCVGRRGKWSVDELSHNAFYDTMTLIGARYGR